MRWFIGLALALSVFGTSSAFAQSAYDDVPTDHWAYNALEYLSGEGVLEGYPDGFFKGDRTLTRYEFAQAIARLLNTIESSDWEEAIRLQADALRAEFSDQLAQVTAQMNAMGGQINDLEGRVSDVENTLSDHGAKINAIEERMSCMKSGSEWKGDFRYRWQFDDRDVVAGDGDRFRQRIRFRIGYNKQINDQTMIGFRLATETGDTINSANYTLGDNGGETADIFLDRAYVKWSPTWFGHYTDADCNEHSRLDIYAGIYPNITYDPHEMILDDDVNFQGAGLVYHFNEDFQVLTAMSIMNANDGNEGLEEDAVFVATELRHENLWLCGLDAWVGCYGWQNESDLGDDAFRWNRMEGFNFNNSQPFDHDNNPNTPNIVAVDTSGDRFSTNFNTVKGGLQYTFPCVWDKPLAIWGEYMVNIDSDADERIALVNSLVNPDIIFEETDDIGWGWGAQWGEKPNDKGDWYWYASYKEIGANAVINGFADSDSGGANTNSFELGTAWAFQDNSTVGITYFLNKMNNAFGFAIPNGKEDKTTIQIDWNFRF
jgi:hypothetical protein